MSSRPVTRFSISMSEELVVQLDALAATTGGNRSRTVADLVRAGLVEHRAAEGDHVIAGSVTLVYDHHGSDVQRLLTRIQHDHPAVVLSTLHVHLDHHNCLEILAVRGRALRVRTLADLLIAARGVKHGKLTVTTTGEDLPR